LPLGNNFPKQKAKKKKKIKKTPKKLPGEFQNFLGEKYNFHRE
jgi:hypothetical protein